MKFFNHTLRIRPRTAERILFKIYSTNSRLIFCTVELIKALFIRPSLYYHNRTRKIMPYTLVKSIFHHILIVPFICGYPWSECPYRRNLWIGNIIYLGNNLLRRSFFPYDHIVAFILLTKSIYKYLNRFFVKEKGCSVSGVRKQSQSVFRKDERNRGISSFALYFILVKNMSSI